MRGALLYEGKSKAVYASDRPNEVYVSFKDDATAFNGVKHAQIQHKGRLNHAISTKLFGYVGAAGIAHHLIAVEDERTWRCERVEIVPVEVVVRNRVAGGIAKRYGLDEGQALSAPLLEYFVKSDALGDPLIGEDAAVELGFAKRWELAFFREQAMKINALLQAFWLEFGIELVDMKLEFGRTADGRLLLADELSPDGARLWELGTGRKLDKDVFRRDLGDLSETYQELWRRINGEGA